MVYYRELLHQQLPIHDAGDWGKLDPLQLAEHGFYEPKSKRSHCLDGGPEPEPAQRLAMGLWNRWRQNS